MNVTTDGPSKEIHVFSPFYDCGIPARQLEIVESVRRNLQNALIRTLTLIIDDGSDFPHPHPHPKLTIARTSGRPSYADWVKLSKSIGKGGYSILCNSDIFFDDSLTEIPQYFREARTFLALSRWDMREGVAVPHPNPHWSQDVWGFNLSDRFDDSLSKGLDIPLGVPRCDNKIAYQFAINGWRIVNPHQQLKAYHLHETEHRAYHKTKDERILGGVAYIHPISSPEVASKVEIDVWAKETHRIVKVSLNKSLDNWKKAAEAEAKPAQPVPVVAAAPAASAASTVDAPALKRRDVNEFLKSGKVVYDHLRRFSLLELKDELLYWDRLHPGGEPQIERLPSGGAAPRLLDATHLARWIRPVVDTAPVTISERPRSKDDLRFWQYPAGTERQAFENHAAIPIGGNIDRQTKAIHTYLALPWATFIDKKSFPSEVTSLFRARIAGLRSLAAVNGYSLKVHTVCQHIHWRRLIPNFREIGITDLHLSHCEVGLADELAVHQLRVHSWPLIAVNVEDVSRSKGLVVAKPIEEKKYLASFLGAHMRHYRSDARLKLLEAAQIDGSDDILVEVNQEWHFNKIVYTEQVANRKIDDKDAASHNAATIRYNAILSDSKFSLCPEGAGPNTLRIWESMAVGSIPVVIGDGWIGPKLGGGTDGAYLTVSKDEIPGLFDRLRRFSPKDMRSLQQSCIAAYQHFRNRTAF